MKTGFVSYIPVSVLKFLRKLPGYPKIRYTGDYDSWHAALEKASKGYAADEILSQVKLSISKVQQGEAVFERDGVCFYAEEYRWPVLTCLLLIAAQQNRVLNVLDYGGSLGSFYFQHKKFLQPVLEHRWFIVEQSHFVDYGKCRLQNEHLSFYSTIAECLVQADFHVALFSSVLQYLEFPYKVLQNISHAEIPYILIDRTPFIAEQQDKLKIQHIPKSIYKASYPLWFFSLGNFMQKMDNFGYVLETEFAGNDQFTGAVGKGFLFKRIIN